MIALRRATLADSDRLLKWRNDPHTVAMCGTKRTVTEAEHDRWLIQVLQDKTRHLYIAEREHYEPVTIEVGGIPITRPHGGEFVQQNGTEAVGMGRLDESKPHVAVLSYLVAPEYRGDSYGGQILSALCAEALKLGCHSLRAEVLRENVASIKALLSEGFNFSPVEMLILEKEIQ